MTNHKKIRFAKITKHSVFRGLLTRFETRLDHINNISNKSQELIDSETQCFRRSIKEEKDHLFGRPLSDNKEITEMLELMGHDTFLRLQYPNLIRKMLLTTIYTTIETYSRELIKLSEENSSSKITLNQLSSTGGELEHFKRYFSIVFDVDFAPICKEWSLLNELRIIRNFIAHHSGNISAFEQDKGGSRRQRLEALIKGKKLEVRENELFIPEGNDFLIQSMKNSKSYLSHICKCLEKVTDQPTVEITWEMFDDGTTKETRKKLLDE